MKDMRKIMKYFAILLTSLILSLSYFQFTHAQENKLEISPLGGNVKTGFVNATNTSFTVKFNISDLLPTQTAKLMIADKVLQSYTEPEIELYTMPESGILSDFFTAGLNTVHVDIYGDSGEIVVKDYLSSSVLVDFTAPGGSTSFTSETGSLALGVGSRINFKFTPDIFSPDIESVVFNFDGRKIVGTPRADGSYIAHYIISQEDKNSVNVPLSTSIADKAGNLTEQITDTTGLSIDTKSPRVQITSPENGKTYASSNIKLNYLIDNVNYTVVLLLNGKQINVKNGENITSLKDGSYELELMATDAAGNMTKAISKFKVDTTPPSLSVSENPSGSKVRKGDKIVFAGTSEPGATILLEVFSSLPQTAETQAGIDGSWKIEFATDNLGIGSHDAFITVSDKAGNSYRAKVSSFEIYIPEKIAFVQSSADITQDVAPKIIDAHKEMVPTAPQKNQEELAKQGVISASQDARATGINWSAWIILLGVVALSSALATAGYYGYAWVVAYDQDRKQLKRADISKIDSKILTEDPEDKEDNRPKPPENNAPKTRW